jgi:arylsulfatase A-like enzyme
MKYKDKFAGGRTIDDLTCSIDLLPTLLSLSGLDTPKNIEGKNLLKLTTNNSDWREYAFSELGSSTQNSVIAVRGKTEKYVLFRKFGKVEYEQLFDLKKDPWETTNLATDGKYAAVLAKMRSVLKKWEAETETSQPVKAVGKVSEE